MGHTYDSAAVIANANQHLPALLVIGMFANLGGFTQMIAGIWMGFKHRTHGVPLVCVTWFFAHDTSYFFSYHYWFHDTHFWLSQGTWYEMGFYMLTELLVMYQILAYSREEVFPRMNVFQATTALIIMQIFAFAVFRWFNFLIDDSLYLIKEISNSILSPLFLIPLMRARGSRKGFNVYSVGAIPVMLGAMWALLFVLDGYFRQPTLLVIAVCDVALAIACLWFWYGLPKYVRPKLASDY